MDQPSFTIRPLSALRRAIAVRMTEANRTIPHFRLTMDIAMNSLLSLREQLKIARPSVKLSINDCLLKACATALMKHPDINIQLVNEEVHQYPDADISVVIATPGGLCTPIVRNAQRKTVWQIGDEVREFSRRAAAGKLKRSEIEGGTFSVTNLGMYGVDQFDAIINLPQCAILALGRAAPRVVASKSETYVASVLRATLSVDHRAIDGATGAGFLATLRDLVEHPQHLFCLEGTASHG